MSTEPTDPESSKQGDDDTAVNSQIPDTVEVEADSVAATDEFVADAFPTPVNGQITDSIRGEGTPIAPQTGEDL